MELMWVEQLDADRLISPSDHLGDAAVGHAALVLPAQPQRQLLGTGVALTGSKVAV
jgi:hypothetical protein